MESRTTIQISEKTRKKLKILASKVDLSYDELLEKLANEFESSAEDETSVRIPNKLFEKVSQRIESTGFKGVDEYVTYVMRQIVTAAELHEGKTKAFTKEDEKEVRERLRALGYI